MADKSIKYFDRASGEIITETVMGDRALRFAYNTLLGRSLWAVLFGGKAVSALMGRYYDSPRSRKDIAKLTAIPGCRVEEAEFPPEHYSSFNDFFARHLRSGARPADMSENVLVSPADGKIIIHTGLAPDAPIPVKGAKRSINELCQCKLPDKPLCVAVVRLAPVDYHRYHFPCDCCAGDELRIVPGKYHSVNPVALLRRPDLFVENTRHIAKFVSPVFGDFLMIEVAAFGVGSIIQTGKSKEFRKMDEKGYFKFGGSTVIMVFETDRIRFDEDILTASAQDMEVLVRCGSHIAEIK